MWQDIGAFAAACWPYLLLIAVISYLLGSVSSAIIVTKLFTKSDIRDYGSGNAGATNVLRSQGKLPAVLTTVGDLGKSILAVLIGWWIIHWATAGNATITLAEEQIRMIGMYLAGLCCILGHLYPLYFGFRGGKGVMTTLGMMLILDWRVALLCLAVFIVVVLISRMVSLGSICAGVTLTILTYVFRAYVDRWENSVVLFCTVMAGAITVMLLFKHSANIRRILKGTENKISLGKKTE